MTFKKAFDLIKSSRKIAVIGHVRPDGDAIGSALALRMAFDGDFQQVTVYMPGDLPKQLNYLYGFDEIQTELPPQGTHYDLLIVCDMSTSDRMADLEPLMSMCENIIVFDHHIGLTINADLVISRPTASATGEIIFEFLLSNDVKITKPIADALYTAISTDTGCFLFPSTTPQTHRIAAELMQAGAEIGAINYVNFRVFNKRLLIGLQQILRTLKFKKNGQISLGYLKNKNKYTPEERDKFKNYVADVKGVRISIFVTREARHLFAVSLRSHGDVHVENVAKRFGGGGHKNASGCTIGGRYKHVVKRLVAEAEKALNEWRDN